MSGNAAEKHFMPGYSIWPFHCPEWPQHIDKATYVQGIRHGHVGLHQVHAIDVTTLLFIVKKSLYRERCVGRDIVHAAVCSVPIHTGKLLSVPDSSSYQVPRVKWSTAGFRSYIFEVVGLTLSVPN
jgi:hypothetical protein